MLITGPFNLTIGTPIELSDPGANSNHPATALQLQNASPFTITVDTGANRLAIQSFTAQTVPAAGSQPITVTPAVSSLAGTTTVAKALTAVWLLAGEQPPMLDGNLTAAAVLSGLANAGIAGVSLLTVQGTAASGGGIFNPATPSPFRLWSWGWAPTTIGPVWPTSGGVVFQAVNLAGFDALDTVSYLEGSSNRLAGLFVPSPGEASFQNFTTANLDVYMNYSTV